MSHVHDVERFDRWAPSYESHWLQRVLFDPVHETLLDLAEQQVANPAAILDVGCGTGRLLRMAQRRFGHATLVGVDPSIAMMSLAAGLRAPGSRIELLRSKAEDLPFADRTFDLVFSTLTFHHWEDQARAVAEVARVMKGGGRWILADFAVSGALRPLRRVLPLDRFLDPATIDTLLRPAGLAVIAARRPLRFGGQLWVTAIGAGA